jgi:rhodanese-related sulfurtransferase
MAERIEARAEEISPERAWQMLGEEARAQLVDVRTVPEWTYVGVPDLAAVGKTPLQISWHVYPGMIENQEFATQMSAAGLRADQSVLFLCRSGGRSLAAARAAVAGGFLRTYSVCGGFEGPVDIREHRGHVAGWKFAGLPWSQT